MERKWTELYTAGKVQMPFEPFCHKRIEQKIRKNIVPAIEEEREERKDKSESDSDYEFKTKKKRKIIATVKSNQKKRSRKSKANRCLKSIKRISKNRK
jgi:hypothetical protein